MDRGLKLEGSRVLITGGASGIGHRMALDAGRRGAAEVVIWDFAADRGAAVCEEIAAAGGRARAFAVNVADRGSVRVAAAETGPIDVLIHSAGVVTGKRLLTPPTKRSSVPSTSTCSASIGSPARSWAA